MTDYIVLEKKERDFPDFSCVPDPPERLYCAGDISLLKTNALAVVGTRRPTAYGRDVTANLTADCVRNGLTVVSGLATGADTVAHETALKRGGKTIAVLGGGFDNIYPADNAGLFGRIVAGGLAVSEYEPSVKPAKFTFPARNRIISALSLGVLVTEAGDKSGALITAYRALEQGREVFAVPGGIYSPSSAGCNRLLLAGHAHMVTSGADIFRKLCLNYIREEKIPSIQLDIESEKVLNILRRDGRAHIDALLALTGFGLKELNGMLFSLEMSGLVEKSPGNTYRFKN